MKGIVFMTMMLIMGLILIAVSVVFGLIFILTVDMTLVTVAGVLGLAIIVAAFIMRRKGGK